MASFDDLYSQTNQKPRADEVFRGHRVPNDWNKWVVEPWARRKLRLKLERQQRAHIEAARDV